MDNKKNNDKPEQDLLVEQLQRLQAEFENYKKRIEKERQTVKDQEKAKLLLKILNIHDDIERAKDQEQCLKEAVQMIHKQMLKILGEEKVILIQVKGQKLDPYKHEVLSQEKGEQDDIIIEELQKGYMHKDKVLRTSKVKVSKKITGEQK